jgi:hypothetical protein
VRPQQAKEYVVDVMREARGDDLERARRAFRGLTLKQMDEEHGQSGVPRSEILHEYEDQRKRHTEAEIWLDSVKT